VLYRPEAFERLTETSWIEADVLAAVRRIVADADLSCRPRRLWPADAWDGWRSPKPLKTLYTGAAGVVLALRRLRDRGHAEARLDLATTLARADEAWQERPGVLTSLDLPEPAHASLFHGEPGILTVLYALAPGVELADRLHAHVIGNIENEANEVFWGAPGTMLAACAMLDLTHDPRWAEAWSSSAERLLGLRDADGMWKQRLHGGEQRSLGPPHGLTGNVAALFRGGALLDGGVRRRLERDAARVLERTAVMGDGVANWPTAAGRDLVGADGEIRLQWCAGAPGVVVSAAGYLDDELLLAGAELIWRAGPHSLEKGAGICHGTAGNGYALLRTFERTGDELWLERARHFAVHALEQVERLRAQRGRGRYSLWTGDIGVAVYAADCLEGSVAYPVYDTWE
jgi:lantibiotic modifying enzyme